MPVRCLHCRTQVPFKGMLCSTCAPNPEDRYPSADIKRAHEVQKAKMKDYAATPKRIAQRKISNAKSWNKQKKKKKVEEEARTEKLRQHFTQMPESELKEKLQVYTQDVLEEMMEAILASKPLKRPEYSPEYSDLDVPDKYREMTLTQLMEADHIHSYIAVTMQPNDWDEAHDVVSEEASARLPHPDQKGQKRR